MDNIFERHILTEKYPNYMLGYIIKKKYHHSNKQEYDEALSSIKIEKQFYKKHFNIDITGYSFD